VLKRRGVRSALLWRKITDVSSCLGLSLSVLAFLAVVLVAALSAAAPTPASCLAVFIHSACVASFAVATKTASVFSSALMLMCLSSKHYFILWLKFVHCV